MNVTDTLEASLRLPRSPLYAVGWADLAEDRVAMPISWEDADADTRFATAVLAGYGIAPGEHGLFVSNGRDYWHRQVETGVQALGGFVGNIGPAAHEDRRLSVYLRYLPPRLIVGVTPELAAKAVTDPDTVALLKAVPHVLALPSAVAVLTGAGVAAKAVGAVGPALALPCAQGSGAHVDVTQFRVVQPGGSSALAVSTVASRAFRLTDALTAARGRLDDVCGCGLAGPVVHFS